MNPKVSIFLRFAMISTFSWRRTASISLLLFLVLAISWCNLGFLLETWIPSETRRSNARFLEVPQIIWGLNNQKIALARAALTARYLNRTLLMPNLSATIFHNASHPAEVIPFDQVFSVDEFNTRCSDFAHISPRSSLPPGASAVKVLKGSGHRWTESRDLQHLDQAAELKSYNLLTIVGKNPFLWPDHWSVSDYVKIFSCLVLNDEVQKDVRVISSRLQQSLQSEGQVPQEPYVAVHMRIERDWMIHCKNTEKRALEKEGKHLSICSSKSEIISRVKRIPGLKKPAQIYLAIADDLLEDTSVLDGWGQGLVPFEKKRLGVTELYAKHSYLVQAAMDFEICKRAVIFVGNSFSTFSSLVVLERSLEAPNSCDKSFAYNLEGPEGGPQPWLADLSRARLSEISYESTAVSCTIGARS